MTGDKTDGDGIFHSGLQCNVVSLTYDFCQQVGRLRMEDYSCCDMTGCIALFEKIDPEVRKIKTFSGEKRDTEYVRQPRGGWRAYLT